MYQNQPVIWKMYSTERGAQNYINRNNLNAHIEVMSGYFYVVSNG